jgi:hypothetical protein
MRVPLLFSFWFTVAAYVVHCIDESLLGQLRGKGAAALVAAVFLDEVFLVQLRIFRGHDRQRDSVRLSGRRVDDPTAGLGDRTRMQRSLACWLVDSLP